MTKSETQPRICFKCNKPILRPQDGVSEYDGSNLQHISCFQAAQSKKSETQLTLLTSEELKRQFEMTYQPEITDLEANEYHGEHRPVVYVDNAVEVAMMMFQQALTSLKSEMEKLKTEMIASKGHKESDTMDRTWGKTEGWNSAISECQRVIGGYLK